MIIKNQVHAFKIPIVKEKDFAINQLSVGELTHAMVFQDAQ